MTLDLSTVRAKPAVLPRITDRVCELVEEVTPALVVQIGVPGGDRLEYDVVVGMAQTPAGPSPVVQVVFTLPSPVLGEELWSASVLPIGEVQGDRAERAVPAVVARTLSGLVDAYQAKLRGA